MLRALYLRMVQVRKQLFLTDPLTEDLLSSPVSSIVLSPSCMDWKGLGRISLLIAQKIDIIIPCLSISYEPCLT